MKKTNGKSARPPPFKKICPCMILPPFFKFFRFPPSPGEVIKIYSPPTPPLKRRGGGVQTMFNHHVLCSNELNHDKNTIFFYNSYIINDLKSKRLIFNMVHYSYDGPSSQFKNQYNFTSLLLHQRDHGIF